MGLQKPIQCINMIIDINLSQLYIDRPFLFNKRKFDIRHYYLLTSQNGIQKGYWFEEGYIRTSSSVFSLKNLGNKMVHLTNDAIQKRSEEYGKFEGGNKVIILFQYIFQISYKELQKYFQSNNTGKCFYKDILP